MLPTHPIKSRAANNLGSGFMAAPEFQSKQQASHRDVLKNPHTAFWKIAAGFCNTKAPQKHWGVLFLRISGELVDIRGTLYASIVYTVSVLEEVWKSRWGTWSSALIHSFIVFPACTVKPAQGNLWGGNSGRKGSLEIYTHLWNLQNHHFCGEVKGLPELGVGLTLEGH